MPTIPTPSNLNEFVSPQPLFDHLLQFDGVHAVSGSVDTSVRVWDVATGACMHVLMGHRSLSSGMELRDNILVSGNASDSTVKVWDINTRQCLQTLSGIK
jgi:F-box/WD-40 domain protein 7